MDQHIHEASVRMERMQIEARFLAAFKPSDENTSFESLRSTSSFDSELAMSDFSMSDTPSPGVMCCGQSNSSCDCCCFMQESDSLEEDSEKQNSSNGYRVGRCYSALSCESDGCQQENPFTFKKVPLL